MADFSIPERIIYGGGSIGWLNRLTGKRLLLVTDCPEAAPPVEAAAAGSGMSIRILHVPRGAACPAPVLEGTKALMEFKPDWTAALGGRGAMDCAKLMCIYYQRPELSQEEVISGGAAELALTKPAIIAIPLMNTDCGEMMGEAALRCGPMEHVIRCPGLLPRYAILDEGLLPRCPEEEDSPGVLSAFAMAVEAIASPLSSPFTRPAALEALRLITGGVMAYSAAPARRGELLLAQCLAGMARFNSGQGLCTAMIRAGAAAFGPSIGFGQGAAIYLPAILRGWQGDANPYGHIARTLGLSSPGPEALAALMEEYGDMLGMPLTLEESGVERNAFLKRLSFAARQAASQPGISQLLGEEAQKKIEELYRSCYSHKG